MGWKEWVAAWTRDVRQPFQARPVTTRLRPAADVLRDLPASSLFVTLLLGDETIVVAADAALASALIECAMGASRVTAATPPRHPGPVEWALWERMVVDGVSAWSGRSASVLRHGTEAPMPCFAGSLRVESTALRLGDVSGALLVARPERAVSIDVVLPVEAADLAPGTVLRTGLRGPIPVELRQGDEVLRRAELGALRGRRAVRLR